jgi:hypothetical protein
MTASSAESAANPPDSPARAARRVAFWSRLNAGDGSVVGMGEHRPSKRHFSFAESHLQMSDNRSYVNYIYLYGRTIPLARETQSLAYGPDAIFVRPKAATSRRSIVLEAGA